MALGRKGSPVEDYGLSLLISSDEIEKRLDALARRINEDYEGREVVVIGILKGSFIFLADLVRRLSMPIRIDFVSLSSYGMNKETSGAVRITKNVEIDLAGRDVLVVEDIVDSGLTLAWFLDHLKQFGPRSVRICALVDKTERRRVELKVDYTGIGMEKGFIVGYGLDYSEKHRNLPGIYEVCFNESSCRSDVDGSGEE